MRRSTVGASARHSSSARALPYEDKWVEWSLRFLLETFLMKSQMYYIGISEIFPKFAFD